MDASSTDSVRTATRPYEALAGPRGNPVLGIARQVDRTSFHRQLERWATEYGSPFRFRIAQRRFIAISDPETVSSVLKQRPGVFLKGPRLVQVVRDLGFHGVFTSDGDDWKRQRQLVLAGLDPTHLKAYLAGIVEVTATLRARWLEAAREQRDIDLLADLMRYTVDVTTGLAFGHNLDTLRQGDADAIQQHLNVIFPTLSRRTLAALDVEHWLPRRDVQEHVKALLAAVRGFIADTRAQLKADPQLAQRPQNLLQALVAACDLEGKLTDDHLSGNVLTMLLAGEDTTANTLGWLTWLLHTHPQAWEQARAEVDAVVGPGGIPQSVDQLGRLDFVEAAANESLRLKPVAPLNIIYAGQDTVIADVAVPKGTYVACLMRPAGLDAARFPQPAAFDPARWLSGGGAEAAGMLSAKRVVMPFGAGPRVCPGRYLALAEIKMVTAMLLSTFDVQRMTTPEGGPRERLALTLSPEGLVVRLTPRPGVAVR